VGGWRREAPLLAERYNLVAQLLLGIEVVAVALWTWRFRGLLAAITAFASSADAVALAPVRSAAERRLFGLSLWVLLAGFTSAWIILLRGGRAVHARIQRGAVIIGLAMAGVMALAWAVPYRLLFQSRAERVSFGGLRCYIVGERPPDALLYCPEAPAPRTRVVSGEDSRMERKNVIESFLDSPE
jgi:hypothetical protein